MPKPTHPTRQALLRHNTANEKKNLSPTGLRSRSRLGPSAEATPGDSLELSPAKGRRLIWIRIPALFLFLGSVWVLYNLFTDVRFRVSEVSISGTKLLQGAEIGRLVNVAQTSIFRVSSKRLEARLLQEFGCIKHVAVTCRLPNRVFVTIEEHEANAVWESGGRYWWIGADGEVLGATEGPGDLLVIHDLQALAPEPQGRITGVPWAYALELRQALPSIRMYDYASDKGLMVYVTAAQWPVYLGYQGNAGEKIAIMKALVEQLAVKGMDVEYIDLRNEQRPTYKKR